MSKSTGNARIKALSVNKMTSYTADGIKNEKKIREEIKNILKANLVCKKGCRGQFLFLFFSLSILQTLLLFIKKIFFLVYIMLTWLMCVCIYTL